jgi:hypothetical protein
MNYHVASSHVKEGVPNLVSVFESDFIANS